MTTTAKDVHARRRRIRRRLRLRAGGRLRLSIFRSDRHIYAQVIDDVAGHTLAAASSLDATLREERVGGTIEAAAKIGKMIAERAVAVGITDVVFDRGGYRYHGRVKALADAAREGGLRF